jgi:hypothetical protein
VAVTISATETTYKAAVKNSDRTIKVTEKNWKEILTESRWLARIESRK